MAEKKRFIDKDMIKSTLAKLHEKQLQRLEELLDAGDITHQEHRLIFDMVKFHGIGLESVEEMAQRAQEEATAKLLQDSLADTDNMADEWEYSD